MQQEDLERLKYNMKAAIIGMGNMGSKYCKMIASGSIPGMSVVAATRVRPERMEVIKDVLPEGFRIYESYDKLYEAYDEGEVSFDAVLIVTPHYSHEDAAIKAFGRGLHVLCDKPAGVYSRQARNMMESYLQAKEINPALRYGYIFHQRTFPVYRKIKEIIDSGTYGKLKRLSWTITDWYRPEAYYKADAWRAAWSSDGGGILLNQCPHNLDLMQWLCGMPKRVQGFCHEGRYHQIEVEDEVTAYFEWENGVTGTFVASTGEAAGVNRLEIAMDDALLVCEKGKLGICLLDKPESEYRKETQNLFLKPNAKWHDIECIEAPNAYEEVLSDFARGIMTASGDEAINSLYLSNAVYLSSWERRMVDIPESGSVYEQEFEKDYEAWLEKKSSPKIPDDESGKQYYYMAKAGKYVEALRKELNRPVLAAVVTFGCQMNARDSEKLTGILSQIGYEITDSEDEADFIIYNTCTVRDNADQRVYGRLGYLNSIKKKKPHLKIALCGCMMQEQSAVEKIQKSYRFVNLIFGTHNIFKFAQLLATMFENEALGNDKRERMVIDIWKETEQIVEDLPISRKYSYKSGINIMFGCNNFCSYCIVPYVRGRERSRRPQEILREVEKLAADGVVEIMLLGQNVNSYGRNLETPCTFAELLQEIEKIEGIRRIRFMTSHPKDLSDELIQVMKNSKKICRHLHLPLQSGSDSILKEMNRRYTKADYLNLVEKIKREIPDIAITTDIIVGFPGETREDVDETIDVVKKVSYDNAFTFIYSKRSGTKAASMENQVPEELVKANFDRLLKVVQETAKERALLLQGKVMEALAEEINEHDASLVTGRLSNNMLVHFPGDSSYIGKLFNVSLDECHGFYYMGHVVD